MSDSLGVNPNFSKIGETGIALFQVMPVPSHDFWNYVYAALPPVTGVFFAALLAFGYTFYFNVRSARNDVLKDFHEDLNNIEDLVTKYWLGNHESQDSDEQRNLESVGHELRSKLNSSMIYRDSYLYLFKIKDQNEYKKLDTDLFMQATGGDFQTKNMKPSPQTYNDIIIIVYKLRMLMRKTRGRKTI